MEIYRDGYSLPAHFPLVYIQFILRIRVKLMIAEIMGPDFSAKDKVI